MASHYFHIGISLKSKRNVMQGVKEYATDSYDDVYNTVFANVVKRFGEQDILKIDVWMLTEHSQELKDYLTKVKPDQDLESI